MAIDVVDQVIDLFGDRGVHVYHEIVHNRHVVERFRARGAVFVEDIDEVPAGGVVVFSAHGIPPSVRARAAERGLTAIDATCPLVTKVHSEAVRFAARGYQILLVGHRTHQEVIGTLGEAPEDTIVVERPEDVEGLSVRDPQRLIYLTQTTLSTDDAERIIGAIRARFPDVREPSSSTICYATTNRQHAVRQIAPHADAVLVVGSANSSNSVRLTEIAVNSGTPAHLLDDASEIDPAWFPRGGASVVLVTAGASAPEDLVAGVCRALIERFGGSIELWDVVEEHVEFALPGALRREMRSRGIDPGARGIIVDSGELAPEAYGAVPVSISAPPRRAGV
jgi:4-hydroxy-3-methylbut-2-enyl diphosphate reductase